MAAMAGTEPRHGTTAPLPTDPGECHNRSMTTPPGWYDDGSGTQRWWDGSRWTQHTHAGPPAPMAPQPRSSQPFSEPPTYSQTPPIPQPGYQPAHRGYEPRDAHGYQPAAFAGQQPGYSTYPAGGASSGGTGRTGVIVGIVVAAVAAVAITIVAVLMMRGGNDQAQGGGTDTATGTTTDAGTPTGGTTLEPTDQGSDADVFLLAIGDCYNDVDADEIVTVPVVDCSQPHDFEVFWEFELEGDVFPSDDDVHAAVEEHCLGAFTDFVGIDYYSSTDLDITWLRPTPESWDDHGDRLVTCSVYDLAGQVTGSLRGAAR